MVRHGGRGCQPGRARLQGGRIGRQGCFLLPLPLGEGRGEGGGKGLICPSQDEAAPSNPGPGACGFLTPALSRKKRESVRLLQPMRLPWTCSYPGKAGRRSVQQSRSPHMDEVTTGRTDAFAHFGATAFLAAAIRLRVSAALAPASFIRGL